MLPRIRISPRYAVRMVTLAPPVRSNAVTASATLVVASTRAQIRANSSTSGSYHSPTAANATLLSDLPSISPRSLVKYLDSYVVGQTKAKKVLAVGVWNHYLRVASNARLREEAELRMAEQQLAEEEQERRIAFDIDQHQQQPVEAPGCSLRLGKVHNVAERDRERERERERAREDAAAWGRSKDIAQERERERERDPHGEAMRGLMFGRGEREWLVNAGGSSAIREDEAEASGIKFGDDLASRKGRTAAKTAAEEADEKDTTTTTNTAAILEDKPGVSYFSSNTFGGKTRSTTSSKATAHDEVDKWESPAHRAAFTDERTKRALKLARERLSSSFPPTAHPPTIVAGGEGGSKPNPDPAPAPAKPVPSSEPSSASSFLSTQPGTLPFFEKSNILLLGPSGSGKTLLLRTLAQALDVPFVHVDATPLTMAGYVGEDVESIIQRLLVEAGWDVARAQRGIVCIDEIDKLRKTTGAGAGAGGAGGKDVGGEGVQQALLRMLEGTVIQVADKSGAAGAGGGGGGKTSVKKLDFGEGAAGEGGLGPWYNQRRTRALAAGRGASVYTAGGGGQQPASFNVDTSSILFVLSGAFVGIEDVIRRRLGKHTSTPASASEGARKETEKEQEQEQLSEGELLARLEPSDLESYGLIPEFVGRVPVSVTLNPLSFADLVRVMREPKNSLVDQYTSLFSLNGIELHISAGAVQEVVRKAMRGKGGGARGLRRVMEEVLLDGFYQSYGDSSVKYVLMDAEGVREGRGVKLFSRGQRFEFEARVRGEQEEYEAREEGREVRKGMAVERDAKKGKEKGKGKEGHVSEQRVQQAKAKARQLVRARIRRTNRLVDPVIYI